MREAFHEQLDSVFDDLAAICAKVETAVALATRALLTGDSDVAEQVISSDADIDRARERVEDKAFALLSLQQPVAGDLRVVVSALRMSASLERMGDLARHIAQVARRTYPRKAVPQPLSGTFSEMHDAAVRVARRTTTLLGSRDLALAESIEADDDLLDELHEDTFTALLGGSWKGTAQETVDVTLLGRYYERFGDHGVSVARRVVFLVTGDYADQVDAPTA